MQKYMEKLYIGEKLAGNQSERQEKIDENERGNPTLRSEFDSFK